MDYDSRIISSQGNAAGGGGILGNVASYHNFHGSMYFNGNFASTTDQIPSLYGVQNQFIDIQNQLNVLLSQTAQLNNYAPSSGAAFTGTITEQ